MNFFKRLIYTFPEFEAFISSVEDMQLGEYATIDAMQKAFSKDFEVFYSGQPSTVSKSLKPIGTSMQHQITVLQDNFTQFATLPKELEVLKEKRKEFEKIKKEHQDLLDHLNTAKQNTQKAQEALNKNANASDKSKYEANLQKCQNIQNDLEKKYNDNIEPFNQASRQFEASFIESLTKSLSSLAEARQKVANEQRNIALEIASSIDQITDYEDKQIPKLKRLLKDLDYEIVD